MVDAGRVVVPAGLDPLAGQEVVAILTDGEGRLLFVTANAVYRWHAEGLQQIHTEPAAIRTARVDRSGRLWIGTEQGLVSIRGDERRRLTARDGLPDDLVARLMVDRDDRLWAGTASGIALVDQDLNVRIVARRATFQQPGVVLDFHQDRRGFVWLATRGSLYRFSKDLFITYDTQKGLSSDIVNTIFCDSANRLWIGTDGGLNRLDPDGTMRSVDSHELLTHSAIRSIREAGPGQIWVGSDRGLFRIGPRRVSHFTTAEGLPSDLVISLMVDRRQRLWVGTDAGYCRFDGDRPTALDPESGAAGASVFLLFESSDGRVWIGTRRKLYVRDAAGLNEVPLPGASERPVFLTAFEAPDSALWIGTYTDGLYRLRDGQVAHVDESNGLPGNTVYAILPDELGFLWMSNNRGVFKVNASELDAVADGAMQRLQFTLYGQSDGIKATECNGGYSPAATRTGDGRLAFSTVGGVIIADPAHELIPRSPPPVVIEQVLVDDREVDPLVPASFSADAQVIELSFVGLDLQQPANVRYRYRIDGINPDWHDLGKSAQLTLSNPGAGSYAFRVSASTTGTGWSEPGARFAFAVQPHFYQTRPFLLLGLIFAAGAVVGGHQLRVRHLKRRHDVLEGKVRRRTDELRAAKENVEDALAKEEVARQELAVKIDELERANRLKTELIGIAAHDLRSPLQLVMGFSELINVKAEEPDYVREKSRIIQETSERMSQLIHDLLHATSLETGKLILDMTRVDLERTARRVLQTYAPLAQRKGQDLQLQGGRGCVVTGDEERIREIIDNLVSNAVNTPRRESPSESSPRSTTGSTGWSSRTRDLASPRMTARRCSASSRS